MGLMERKKAGRRQRILAVARHYFSEKSFESTTMQEIATGAEVAVGTLYGYFRNKVAIAEALSAEDLDRATAKALSTLPTASVVAQLLHVFRVFYEHHRQEVRLMRVVVKELSLACDADSPQREARFMTLFESLANLVADAQQRGEITPEADAFDVAVNAFALYYFYLVGFLSGQPAFDPPEEHLERALAMLFRGLTRTDP